MDSLLTTADKSTLAFFKSTLFPRRWSFVPLFSKFFYKPFTQTASVIWSFVNRFWLFLPNFHKYYYYDDYLIKEL